MSLELVKNLAQLLAAIMVIFATANQLYVRRRLVARNLNEWQEKVRVIRASPKAQRLKLWVIFWGQIVNGLLGVIGLVVLLSLPALPRTLVIAVVFFTLFTSYWFYESLRAWKQL